MDRTYLSAPAVVTASREFVCVRVATFEDPAETAFGDQLYRGRPGLENTVFALLEPDGVTPLTRSGRSPRMVFEGEDVEARTVAMVAEMEALSARYADGAKPIAALPTTMDLRRGLNVASCDLQPLVVLAVADEAARTVARAALAELAWHEDFVGECQFAVVASGSELAVIEGLPEGLVDEGKLAGDGAVLVVEPDRYGLEGKVLAHAPADRAKAVRKALEKGLAAFEASAKDSNQHVRTARRAGVRWEPAVDKQEGLPESDEPEAPEERRRRRGRDSAPGDGE